ncbi:MAG: NAD-glutamate dehydrogenase [Actinomycetota bacterium]
MVRRHAHGDDPSTSDPSGALTALADLARGSELVEEVDPYYYYRHVPVEDIAGRTPEDLLGAMVSHIALASDRKPGTARVHVYTPTVESDGWSCGRTVVEIVTDDMPFLVDSVSSELTRLGRGPQLVIHPVFRVLRDDEGGLVSVGPVDAEGSKESWIHVEIDRGPGDATAIESSIRRVLADVRAAVDDWPRMREAVLDLSKDLVQNPPASVPKAEADESAALLGWLADDNFTFLGYREYDLVESPDGDSLIAVEGSGLGILRPTTDAAPALHHLTPEVAAHAREPRVLVLTTANSRSTIHRPAYLDYVGVKRFDEAGRVIGEHRFLGLFAGSAYSHSVREIPVLRATAQAVLDILGFDPRSHSGKDVLQFLETYPRDELFQLEPESLARVALAVHQLAQRRQTRLFVHRDPYGRFVSCLVYLPRDRYTTAVRLEIQEILRRAYDGATVDYTARVSESVLARLHVVIHAASGHLIGDPDIPAVQEQISAAVRSWEDSFQDLLRVRVGDERSQRLEAIYGGGFPPAYQQEVPPEAAVRDVLLAETLESESDVRLRFYAPQGRDSRDRRLKVMREGGPISLSRVLPVLSSLGVLIEDEHPYELIRRDRPPLYIYDLGFRLPEGAIDDHERLRELFEDTFLALWDGRCEPDALNALVVTAGLDWRQVVILRAYVRYLQQSGNSLSQEFVESALNAHQGIARLLIDFFEARFDPSREEGRRSAQEESAARILKSLDAVSSLDQDRVLRSIFGAMRATLRTNAYQRDEAGRHLDRLSFKVNARDIPELPLPRPYAEIWVYSPRVEGVHLRFGTVARGGLRWSDRRADFRTEVLGLVKAQEVKNAVIVPVGAKGGFVPKALPDPATDRDAWLAEGRGAYATFIRGLLDITDNRADGQIIAPRDVVRHDGEDPYLVVAADKGTATFSDLANSVAAEYSFWLGDAFASGGSAGYDHKAMGITARGAWLSVQRHFRELGIDTQHDDFSVVGIGDMSGDVFGNGMLLSEHIRLLAAFDHRHIFLDPDPDTAASFRERRRLFDLPRSSWEDYDPSLISAGGGVYPRSAKSIPITPQVRAALDISDDVDSMTPADLINRILTSPADLLWNGGIGTYVKAQIETNASVGDKANDAVRVDGHSLRCRVVGEGGNLGLTQLGRVEAARHGVKLNTDAIDNSAGVDTSDHEVNIKILLDSAAREGQLEARDRDELLASMTDEVGSLVLRDNYEQNVLLGNARAGAPALVSVHQRLIDDLEARGILNRALEYLPDDEELLTRAVAGQGLTSPELAVLAAYSKIALTADLADAQLADDPWFSRQLTDYFPAALRDRFAERIDQHPLRESIVTTAVVNQLINDGGISVVFRACEETGTTPVEAVRAAAAVTAIFDLPAFWAQVEALDNVVPTSAQDALFLQSRRLLDRAMRWFLQTHGAGIDVTREVERFGPTVHQLAPLVPDALVGVERERMDAVASELIGRGAPPDLAVQAAAMLEVFALLDVVQIADRTGQPAAEIMPLYFALSERYDVDQLLRRITALPRGDRWTALARQALRTDLYAALAGLTRSIVEATPAGTAPMERILTWESRYSQGLARAQSTLDQIAAHETGDLATISVALRVLRNLVAQGQVGSG